MKKITAAVLLRLLVAAACTCVVVPSLSAATITPTVDTPWSFRAALTGVDTDPYTIDGNDFTIIVFKYWTVQVNLRGDSVDGDGNASGFYEIQLKHTGSLIEDPTAPIVNTFLFYSNLQPNTTMVDSSIASQPHGDGTEYLSTTVNILFDPGKGTVTFSGSIAGDADLNGDGVLDTDQPTDKAVQTLNTYRDLGIITGKEMGQVIKQTRKEQK